jgi:hypothetical protein
MAPLKMISVKNHKTYCSGRRASHSREINKKNSTAFNISDMNELISCLIANEKMEFRERAGKKCYDITRNC